MRRVAEAKKAFYDWLDYGRPWDQPLPDGVYDMMEDIIAAAERAFSICEEEPDQQFKISKAQARKMFYDFMDDTRPWANPANQHDPYAMMERMVSSAAWCFAHEMCPTKEDISRLEDDLITVTTPMGDHPDGYEGTCNCAECRSCG